MFKYWCAYIWLPKYIRLNMKLKTYFQNEKLNHKQHHRM